MKNEKEKIILDQLFEKIDGGEFDKYLNIPFTSRKLLKSLVESKMDKKTEQGNNPIFSDSDIQACVEEVRETAAHTASVFLQMGLLKKDENGLLSGELLNKLFKTT